MSEKTLFEPYALGGLKLTHRVVMAPLTRPFVRSAVRLSATRTWSNA
ncbi:MAG: hypothetical protein ACTHNZ_07130 [Trinickia sp.]|jgi:2,4-dienoyl-CoA reductase-like NADH-dependent reductase (Old Yellow Enzyme family)